MNDLIVFNLLIICFAKKIRIQFYALKFFLILNGYQLGFFYKYLQTSYKKTQINLNIKKMRI